MSFRLNVALTPVAARVRQRNSFRWQEKEDDLVKSCHPKQRGLVLDPAKRISARVGRGGGKTTGLLARYVRRMMLTVGARCLYIATVRDHAIDLMWEPLKDVCHRLGIEAKFNETRLVCKFIATGSVLRLAGADDMKAIEKYRGQPFHEAWVDEAASHKIKLLNHLIERIIEPRLGEVDGVLGLVGTPGHILSGDFYDYTRPGSPDHRPYDDRDNPEYADWDGWSSHTWTLEDGAPFVKALAKNWAAALATKKRKGWSDKNPIWLREYLGQWAADDTDHVYRYRPHDELGGPWNQWAPEIDPITRFALLPEDLKDPCFVYGMDFGHTDPTALEIFAYSPQDPFKRLIHVYEHVARHMHLRQIAKLLIGERLDLDDIGGVIGVTDWPDTIVADPKSLARGYIDELNKVYGVHVALADQRDKNASIEMTNGDLIDGRIWVIKGSILEEQLLNLQWILDEYGQVREEDPRQRNDATDCLIYARRAAGHLLSLDEPKEEQVVHSPYSTSRKNSSEATKGEFDDLLENGGFDGGVWG